MTSQHTDHGAATSLRNHPEELIGPNSSRQKTTPSATRKSTGVELVPCVEFEQVAPGCLRVTLRRFLGRA
jgi:hypothetical protein